MYSAHECIMCRERTRTSAGRARFVKRMHFQSSRHESLYRTPRRRARIMEMLVLSCASCSCCRASCSIELFSSSLSYAGRRRGDARSTAASPPRGCWRASLCTASSSGRRCTRTTHAKRTAAGTTSPWRRRTRRRTRRGELSRREVRRRRPASAAADQAGNAPRPLVPRSAVRARPLQHLQVAAFRGIAANPRVPRTPSLLRPRQPADRPDEVRHPPELPPHRRDVPHVMLDGRREDDVAHTPAHQREHREVAAVKPREHVLGDVRVRGESLQE